MPLEGYIRKKPDPAWWMEQIKAGESYRKHAAYEASWNKWRAFYRGSWRADVMPVNLFFSLLRSTVPRVYFRNPTVSITPGKPGLLFMAFAQILERTDNKLIRQMKLKNHMKRCIQDAFLFGTGALKVGFGGVFTPSPSFNLDFDNFGRDKQGHLTEFLNTTAPNMPWVSRLPPGNLVTPPGLMSFDETPWLAHEIIRPLDDVRRDPRLKGADSIKTFVSEDPQTDFGIRRRRKMVRLYEIRDWRTHQVFVIAPDKGDTKILFSGFDEFQIVGMPILPLIFNEDDEYAWGLPDSRILEPYQLEANEIRTQMMKHRRVSIAKILARRGSIREDEAAKLVSEDVLPVIFTEGDPRTAIDKIVAGGIPQDLILAGRELMQDMREAVGFGRNQFGEFNSRSADTTATEARIVQAASDIRVDERRDAVADLLITTMEHVNTVIFNHWTQEDVVDVVGPGGVPVWVQFQGKLLREGHYHVKIDPDSSLPETRELREARAIQLYDILKQNPLIEPFKLTQYLLNELRGTSFDDMLRMLPQVAGPGNPDRPVSPPEFANMVGESIKQVPERGLNRPQQGGSDHADV